MSVRRLSVLLLLLVPAATGEAQRTERAGGGAVPHRPGSSLEVELWAGDQLDAGTCDLPGAETQGDTYLRLLDPDGVEVARNDDGCLVSLGSRLQYRVPEGRDGVYTLRMECFGRGDNCGGTLAYRAQVGAPRERPESTRIRFAARAVAGHDGQGGGAIADLEVDVRLVEWLTLRLDAGPVGLAGGTQGGLVGGSSQLMLMAEFGWGAVGVGGGATALGYRDDQAPGTAAAVVSARLRLGSLDNFRVAGELRAALLGGVRTHSFRGEIIAPIDDVDLALRGAGGDDGTLLGEAAVVFWLDSGGARRHFGLSVHAGVGGVFYQPLCRFDRGCSDTRWVVGPLLGAGFEWRP